MLAVILFASLAAAAVVHVTKGSLPSKTGSDVSTLIARESAVQSDLNAFKKLGAKASVSGWESQLKAAESAQSSALATLNADLASKPKSPSSSASPGSVLSFKDENGNPYRVQAVQVIDPAQGADQYTTPNAGDRFVAVVFKITDTGSNQISDDANNNASVIASNDQTYTADFDSVSECTNFKSGEYQLAKGQAVTGCVVFQVPTDLKVTTVEWSPGFGENFGEWKVS
jgi:hypothetical protein